MNKKVSLYIQIMGKEIRNEKVRAEAQLEIENHLLDQIEDLISKTGINEEQAVENTLANATPPKTLGKKLNLAHLPFWWRYPILTLFAAGSILGGITLIFLSHYLVNDIFAPRIQSALSTKDRETILDEFSTDLQLIQKNIYYPKSRKLNASSYIDNKFQNFDIGQELYKRKQLKDWLYDEKTLAYVTKNYKDFGIDVGWVAGLMRYDYWNYYDTEKNRKDIKQVERQGSVKKIGLVASMPIPEVGKIKDQILIYILTLIEQKEFAKAESFFDHGISLYLSTNNLVGWAMAAHLMNIKNKWAQLFEIKNWQRISSETVVAYKRVGWGWAGLFSDSLLGMEDLNDWEKWLKPELGMCTGLMEHPMGKTAMAEFLFPRAPFEKNYQQEILDSKKQTLELLDVCDSEVFNQLLVLDSSESKFFDPGLWQTFFITPNFNGALKYLYVNPTKIPYLRRIFAYYLYSVAIPNYFGIYRRKLTAQK